ncbi:hypothetical protein QT970_22205 [Microcoleus sp. herbarium8]
MKITVLDNQTLMDVAIRHCGTIEALTDIAILNNISITAELVAGQSIEMPNKDYGFQEVVNYFTVNKVNPATALTDEDSAVTEGDSGIGFWEIENNFTVQ